MTTNLLSRIKSQQFRLTTGLPLLVSLLLITPASQAQEGCDSACLRSIADQYLAAMVQHDATELPLADSPATTLNSAPVGVSNAGPWASSTGLGEYRAYIVDPIAGEIAVITSAYEGEKANILALRLKIEDRLISEAELLYQRDKGETGAHFNPEGLSSAEPLLSSVVPAGQRSSREELIRMSQATWRPDSVKVPYQQGCKHYEEGDYVSDPRACPAGNDTPKDPNSRSPIADVERGLVVSYATVEGFVLGRGSFIPNSMLAGTSSGMLNPRPGNIKAMPASAHVMQILKVVDGKVQITQAYMNIHGQGMQSPWVEME